MTVQTAMIPADKSDIGIPSSDGAVKWILLTMLHDSWETELAALKPPAVVEDTYFWDLQTDTW